MEAIFEDFITDTFLPDFVLLVKKCFSLFEAFEHQNAYSGMVDAITNESISDQAGRSQHFTNALVKELDFILNEHLIELTDEATIRDKVDILDGLYRLQHLEDYAAIASILSTEDEHVDKMAKILDEVTSLGEGHLLTLIKRVNKLSISLLEVFVEEKTLDPEVKNDNKPEVIKNFKLFTEALGKENIGSVLADAGMIIGLPISLYLPFVEEDIYVKGDLSQTALNFMSLIYLSDIKEMGVIGTYRHISENILESLDIVSQVESHILKHSAKIEDLRKVNYDKAGLSQTRLS